MSDNKKYYYMRLKEDFFDSDEIKIIESQPNGYMYSNILLKLYLKSLKRNGKLMVTDFIPYTLESLSKVLGHNIDTVRNAIAIFKEFRLIEELSNGAIFMTEIQNFIGQSTTEADRKREYRLKIDEEKKKLNQRQMSQIEGQKSQKSNGEIVEIIEVETDKSPDKCPTENQEVCNNAVSEISEGQMSGQISTRDRDISIAIDREREKEQTPTLPPLTFSTPLHELICKAIGEIAYRTWFTDTQIVENGELVSIAVKDDFKRQIIQSKFADTLRAITGKTISVKELTEVV
ncbi:phage replisome organizer N-terminal domain-containing protein [Clostridium beijerinckii]|uniref:phage replisome organizer N-terminal domain-containing protein n=1 Tax=Clostridium beijerinckii TaxID=1520 RepID=UPI001361C94E|nr:phage replisome organizer N-terminal domain-containing protein [Clostridium beijerinckii]MZL01875.1 hypothetical protein [Clostridium beijerinckii]